MKKILFILPLLFLTGCKTPVSIIANTISDAEKNLFKSEAAMIATAIETACLTNKTMLQIGHSEGDLELQNICMDSTLNGEQFNEYFGEKTNLGEVTIESIKLYDGIIVSGTMFKEKMQLEILDGVASEVTEK